MQSNLLLFFVLIPALRLVVVPVLAICFGHSKWQDNFCLHIC